MMSAAATIKKIRLHMCLEVSEFARLLSMSKSAIWHYERGSRLPRIPTVRKIMNLAKKHKIKVSVEDFLT